jgi:hypothetical protein
MPTFLALVVAPLLALACQGAMFALVTPSCSVQTRLAIHAVAAVTLVLTAVIAVLARRHWRLRTGVASVDDERSSGRMETRRVLAAAGTAVAVLSSLVVLMMWFAAWALSPCLP